MTRFEPFGGETVNPSWEVVERLGEAPPAGVEVIGLRLPVVRYRAVAMVMDAVERLRPHVVLMLGQAGGRARLTPERVAINVDDYRLPDHEGNQPRGEPIAPDGPAAYFCTLPVRRMVEAMQAHGVPASLSNSAGTYLCNHVAYGVLHELTRAGREVAAGFVHLPYLPEQVIDKPGDVPSVALDTMLVGVGAAVASAYAAPVLAGR